MKKWLIIILILVIALACGITAAGFWDYVVEIIQIAIAYLFDLARSIIDVLANKITEATPTPLPETDSAMTASIFVPRFIFG